ncbi:serine hydrolase [Mobilitalea sibirica]|uniref:Serine hydrolase n=1 Tax=Mobilitalea sibirica TaxID=1462919 RepID=A0A8J7KXW0_9FIRM|nr:serine hydrolase [Mobilitalea sibirica]MBH1942312.1 serine hydrolase [Mobilitalea sibirica]
MERGHLNHIKALLDKEIATGAIHGSAIRIIHENAVVYEEQLGYAVKENNVPIAKNTIYKLFSMTKPITTTAVMILYERGVLDLLEPVSKYLEGFRNQKVWTEDGLLDVAREVTLQDLLNMTSGVVYPDESFEAGRRMGALFSEVDDRCRLGKPVNTVDFCNRIGRMPLEFQPGERWRYGASADILGAVVEVASGMKLSEFFQKEIFTPLGMVDTGFFVPKEKQGQFAAVYNYNEETKQLELFQDRFLGIDDCLEPPAFESGGAGLVSTVEDYSRFALMLLNEGCYQGKRILGRKTVAFMSTPQLTKEQSVSYNWDTQYGYNYGNLMRSFTAPIKASSNGSIGEYGWDGWTGNYFFIDPSEKLIMIYMIQRCAGGNPSLIRRLRQIVYGAL